MVIDELPIGSRVRFGRYSISDRDSVIDIDWIKVSDDNQFITEKVLLGTKFDEYEGFYGNRGVGENKDYMLSNIRQFINSEELSWYTPAHPTDRDVGFFLFDSGYGTNMRNYKGLLYHFSDSELSMIERKNGDLLRIPTYKEIDGGFSYFKKHGKSAFPVEQYGVLERKNYEEGMRSSYYVREELTLTENKIWEVTRGGRFRHIPTYHYSGVRPVCTIIKNIEVRVGENGLYEILKPSCESTQYFKASHSIEWLLDL